MGNKIGGGGGGDWGGGGVWGFVGNICMVYGCGLHNQQTTLPCAWPKSKTFNKDNLVKEVK
jgi:hypothetical protein